VTRLALLSPAVALAPDPGDNVTNHFALPGDGMLRDTLYNNNGATGALQAFLTSGLMPITDAMRSNGFSLSISASAPNWIFNAARINFYTSSVASSGTLAPSGSVTTGVTLSSDVRTLSCVSGSIPATATHFGTNLKWAQGIPSLIYASTNIIPTGAEDELALNVMVNSTATANCLSDPGAPGTSEEITTPPVFADDEFICAVQGYSTYTRRRWQTGKHMVTRTANSPESHDYNNCYNFFSVCEIADTVSAPATPGAFSAALSNTGANATTYAVQSDCHPAYRINGMYLAGVHGIVSSFVTANGHGKTNAARGSRWLLSSVTYLLTMRYDANRLFLTRLNTGTTNEWSIATTTAPTGTATHVSGGSETGDIVITASTQGQLWPATNILSQRVWFEGGRELESNGVFVAKQRIQEVVYQVPNAAEVLNAIEADVGSSDDFNYNDPSLPMQLEFSVRWIDDAWSARVEYQVTALQDHVCTFSWPMQWQQINARSSVGETLWFIVPGTKSCAAGATHSGGTPLDFSSFQNISSNVLEYYHDAPVWQDASWWTDSVKRPAWVQAYGVKDSGGNWLRKFVMARSRIAGWTADGDPGLSHLLSAPNKSYSVVRAGESVSAGDVRKYIAFYGWIDPAFDTEADINFPAALGGGQFEWNWWAAGSQASYSIPIRADLVGKRVQIICSSANCDITIDPGTQTVTLSKTGDGGFVALVG